MSEIEKLGGLIQDLRKSTSRIGQLRILTQAWKTVQNLSPAQRAELAKHIGMREGLPLLERLGKPGGVSPAALAQAVVKAEQSSPGQLNQILRDLRTASTRGRGVRESVTMLDSVLHQSSDAGVKADQAETEPPLPPPPRPRPAGPLVTESPAPEPIQEPVEAKSPANETRPARPRLEPVRKPVGDAEDAAPAERQPPPASSLKSVPNPVYPDTPGWGRPFGLTEEKPVASPQSSATTAWSTAGVMRSLRKLDQMIDCDPGLEERLESVLSEIPPGWPRRRALAQLIRSGAVSKTSQILAAIAALPNQFDEFWCLSAWLHANQPDRAELEEALRQTRGPAGKRLLKARLSR